MLMCNECGMWRLVYASRKLKVVEIRKLNATLDGLSFSCGADLQEAGLPAELDGVVYVKKMYCNEPIERLHYSANFDDICVYCAGDVPPWSSTEEFYPQCDDCADKPRIANVKSLNVYDVVIISTCIILFTSRSCFLFIFVHFDMCLCYVYTVHSYFV